MVSGAWQASRIPRQAKRPEEKRQARDGQWYTKEEFLRFYERSALGGRHYWEEAGWKSAESGPEPSGGTADPAADPLGLARFLQHSRRMANWEEGAVLKTGEPRPASSDATADPAAEPAAVLAGPSASQPELFPADGAAAPTPLQLALEQAVWEPAEPGPVSSDGTLGAAAERAAALVPLGASQSEPVPADGTLACIASHLLGGQAVAEAGEPKPDSPGASQIGPLPSDGSAASASTGGAAQPAPEPAAVLAASAPLALAAVSAGGPAAAPVEPSERPPLGPGASQPGPVPFGALQLALVDALRFAPSWQDSQFVQETLPQQARQFAASR